jgi:ribosomal protein L16 Arg81 hydroxylase
MHDQVLTFRQLIAPTTAQAFFNSHFGQRPLHVEAPSERYADLFSWDELNALLRMTAIWSNKSLEMSMNGRRLPTEAYCYEGTTRDNERGWRPDFERVGQHLKKGASMTLNYVGRLTPSLRSLSQTFEAVFGSPVNIFAFCSWEGVGAYPSHFDTGSVFVCQIDGRKTWNLYEGRMPNAAHSPGCSAGDFPQEFHEKTKGKVLHQIELNPGDLLYVPHGQYHDAVASSDVSLHLSIAVRHMVAHDLVNVLAGDLPKDPLFREHLPHIDAVAGSGGYRKRLAQRLGEIIEAQQISDELRRFLHAKAYEGVAEFDLPHIGEARVFRVRWIHFAMAEGENRLQGPNHHSTLDDEAAAWARWALARDYFSTLALAEAFPQTDPRARAAWLQEAQTAGLIEVMA